ncbi:MAG: hypothetical protein P8Y58_17300 [Novosphingobium sp.]
MANSAFYKQRHVIERVSCRQKDWRSIAIRFDRSVKNFMGAIARAATIISWL